MAGRFNKFTERSRHVLTLAQEEAQRLNHKHIGTEHILLALCRVQDGVAAHVLGNLGVNLDKAREAAEFITASGERPSPAEIGLTPRAKKVIELAVEEARRMHHSYIGTEHLLLGLIREGKGVAFGVLESLGVSLDRARGEVKRALSGTMPPTPGYATLSGESLARLRLRLVQVAPDTQRRKRAADSIQEARELLQAFRGTEVEEAFASAYLMPQLNRLWSALEAAVPEHEVENQRQELLEEAKALASIAEALRTRDRSALAAALSAALDAIREALAP